MHRKTFISNIGKSLVVSLIPATFYSCSKKDTIWQDKQHYDNVKNNRLYELTNIYWVEDNEMEKIPDFIYIKHIVKVYKTKFKKYSESVRVRYRNFGTATYNEKDMEGKFFSVFTYKKSKPFELFGLNNIHTTNIKPIIISQDDFQSFTLNNNIYVNTSS